MNNAVVRSLAGGLASAMLVAGPLVDNGVAPSEAISIAFAFLTGTGLAGMPNGRDRVVEDRPVEGDPNA